MELVRFATAERVPDRARLSAMIFVTMRLRGGSAREPESRAGRCSPSPSEASSEGVWSGESGDVVPTEIEPALLTATTET